MRTSHFAALLVLFATSTARADTPSVSYIYPAGGQRGASVDFRVGGHFLHEGCPFRMDGPGVQVPNRIERTKTIWFEGPVIPQPASQAKEDYPKDYAGKVTIAADAPLGPRAWRVWTSQGVTPGMAFVVGDLPEILEQEADGKPIPTPVTLPVTINGRIFPREDIDIWTFTAKAGQTVTCEVNAARLGSGLDPRLEVYDASGKMLAENSDALGSDSLLHFTAPADGTYAVHIYDERFSGLQHFVYRLTITSAPWVDAVFPLGGRRGTTVPVEVRGANVGGAPAAGAVSTATVAVALPAEPQRTSFETQLAIGSAKSNPVTFELDDLPEVVEPAEAAGAAPAAVPVTVPVVANGRIGVPGDIDLWSFPATKGTVYEIDLRAARLGSPLDSVITLLDDAGKTLASHDDIGGPQTDSRLTWTAAADGTVTLRVEDRLASRGGPQFAYRLRIATKAEPDFRITIPADSLTVERMKPGNLKLNVERIGGFAEEIDLEIAGLPEGVTAANTKIGKGQPTGQITLTPGEKTKIQTVTLSIKGKAKIGDKEVVRPAVVQAPGLPEANELFLSVGMPTPFKFAGVFETKFISRGSVYVRGYKIDRNGFDGPLEFSIADRQNRHLQGTTGPLVTIPGDATTIDYPLTMPPYMEIGRTSRTCLMAVGIVTDFDGSKHKVSYSSEQQNDQIIAIVDPTRLSVMPAVKSLKVTPGSEVQVPFDVNRGVGLSGPVAVSLVVPEHIRGITASPVTVPADAKSGTLTLRFADRELGPFNAPLNVQAVIKDERGFPVTTEAALELVP